MKSRIVTVPALSAALWSGAALAHITHLPKYAALGQSGDIVAFNLQNPTAGTLPQRFVTFGQVFADGAVRTTDNLRARFVGFGTLPVQMDVKATYADGSVKDAVLTVKQVALAAGQTLQGVIQTGGPAPGAAVNLDTLAQSLSEIITLTVHPNATPATFNPTAAVILGSGANTYTFDVGSLVHAAIQNGTISYWLQGPHVTEGRIDVPVVGSLHLVVDLASYNIKEGHIWQDVQFRNDNAMQPTGGPIVYDFATKFNGAKISYPAITQYQYQDWHQILSSDTGGGSVLPAVNVQHDVLYLEKAGAIPSFSVRDGVQTSLITGMVHYAHPSPFMSGQMLNNDGITMDMGATGGRCDIGFFSCVDAAWLMTQDPTAAAEAIGWADSAGAIVWHYWDPVRGHWLSIKDYPQVWADNPNANWQYIVFTQKSPLNADGSPKSGWKVQISHAPSLSYVPYLLTGLRYYWDNTLAQADGLMAEEWPWYRDGGDSYGGFPKPGQPDLGIVDNLNDQIRGAAWGLRDWQDAEWIAPDNDPMKSYLTMILANDYAYLRAQTAQLQTLEGQPYGYLLIGGGGGSLATWQQDYLQAEISLEAYRGSATARSVTSWGMNWNAGRFLNHANGYSPWNGAAYYIAHKGPGGNHYSKWNTLAAALNASTNGCAGAPGPCTGWNPNNVYIDTVLAALGSLAEAKNANLGGAAPGNAITWLYANDANGWLTPAGASTQPQFDVRPIGN